MKNFSTIFIVALVAIFFNLMNSLQSEELAINSDGSAADGSAILDIKSTGRGILVPRMEAAQRPQHPATGLLFYQTDAPSGFYYNTGSPQAPSWQLILNATPASRYVQPTDAADHAVPSYNGEKSGESDGRQYHPVSAAYRVPHKEDAAAAGTVFIANWQGALYTTHFSAINGSISSSRLDIAESVMPVSGIFHSFNVSVVETAAPSVQNVILTLYVNGVATQMSCSLTASDLVNTPVRSLDNMHEVRVSAGDRVAIGVTQQNTKPGFRYNASIAFK